MLGQLKNGNMVGNTFSRKAWNHMVKFFNKKFDAQYDKSFLKHRYDKLGNYYSDIKNLLKLKDFSWDEKKQRIVADDYVWDNFIKAHPHVSLYRNKTLLNYRDLGLIYRDAMCNGHCSYMLEGRENEYHSDGVDEDTQDCAIGDWTPCMDRYLIDLMLEEVRRGNKIDYVLNSQAWTDMVVLFKERFGVQFEENYLKHRCKGMEKLYHDLRSLLEQRGFSWDETRQMITAYDGVWDAYIMEHPDANSYRDHQKPNYNDLCLIYGNLDTELTTCNLANQNVGYNGYCVKFQSFHWTSDWTPPMDRYFMDLMLEEVRNGSIMIDHKFDRLAWRDMVAKFSAEFGSQYNKYVLKSRYLNLRKRFDDMKILLSQSGFAWDEMQQMITGDERLWDVYVKAHPHLNAYRNRTLPNFNDLFLIYGNTNRGRNQNYSGCSRVSKDNEPNVWEYYHSPANDEPTSIAWTVEMNHYLIGLLLEQLNRGNKIGDTFSKKAWSRMTASFNKEFGLLCDRDALENWYFGLTRVYKDVTYLLNQNGIVLDKIQHKARANDVWRAYFEDYPEAVAFGETIRDNYSGLCLLFGNLNQNRIPGCARIKLNTSNNNFGVETNEIMRDLQSSARVFKISDGRKRRKSQAALTSSNARKVQKTLLGEMQDDLEDKIDDSIERIVAALQTVPDLDDELFLEACLLLEDERKAGMFVAMDSTARRKWLLKKLHQ
ncbi:uncharacterized protein LOC133294713 isoform X2 [Gastrolobium bilobum]|uniref:uncharacterized protein LOC133294713 isoform X2 n=1 Tax=Gastrolobium bilobum TaxID=150636 RepID=UPI002AB040F5|nr:uncharacterized protein LOC133294713 isoform X2 [Gastrolobium bilobum]